MKSSDTQMELVRRYLGGDATLDEARRLESMLAVDAQLRRDYLAYARVEAALSSKVRPKLIKTISPARWLSWRPLAAAAAGIVFGMFCTSVVFGFVSQRSVAKMHSLKVFDPSFEGKLPLDEGLPHQVGIWGVKSARVVSAENGVRPLQGQKMLRMEPVLMRDEDERLYSVAFQVLDLQALTGDAASGSMEVQVAASFCVRQGAEKEVCSIKLVALNEPPEIATRNFWPKLESEGVVSLSQRFEAMPEHAGWQTFSVKMPLPRSAQSLVIILSATSPRSAPTPPAVRYLDNVQANLLITPEAQSSLP